MVGGPEKWPIYRISDKTDRQKLENKKKKLENKKIDKLRKNLENKENT